MWEIAICDDESLTRETIRKLVEGANENFSTSKITMFKSGEELLSCTYLQKMDLIFLDIQMAGMSGIKTAQMLRERGIGADIVFLTNYDEYYQNGYEVSAFRYRKKPLDEDLIRKDLQEWQKKYLAENYIITIQAEDGIRQIKRQDILYLEVEHRKTKIVTINSALLSKTGISDVLRLLGEGFLETYHKIYVNREHVKLFNPLEVHLTGDIVIPMSRRKYGLFKEKMIKG